MVFEYVEQLFIWFYKMLNSIAKDTTYTDVNVSTGNIVRTSTTSMIYCHGNQVKSDHGKTATVTMSLELPTSEEKNTRTSQIESKQASKSTKHMPNILNLGPEAFILLWGG